jgi:subtilase family serine protease
VIAGTTAGAGGAAAAAARPTTQVPLAGTAAPFTRHTHVTAEVAGSRSLTIQLWLKPDLAGAQRFATAVSTPGSASFRHFLSPEAYTARFGPSAREAGAAESWLRSKGFTGIHANGQRDYVRATAPVSKINAAFHVIMKLYQATKQVNAGPYPLRANDRPVTLPAWLASDVLGVTGLDNAAPILPLQLSLATAHGSRPAAATGPCSSYYGQHSVSGVPSMFGTTSFPTEGCGYSAAQLRAAYGASTANTGTGQTVALVELGLAPKMFLTLQDYAKANKLPAPSSARYQELNQQPASCRGDAFAIEEQLDVESSYDMAPGASQLVVGGNGCDFGDFGLQGLFNADTAVINGNGGHPLATIVSNSWESGGEGQAASLTSIEHSYLLKAVSAGVGMYFSSGDGSGALAPSDDPDAIAVGGTTLGIGKTSNRLFETGWSNGGYIVLKKAWHILGENGAAGGGPSLLWRQPSYQKGVVPSSMSTPPGNRNGPVRVIPDISADANQFTGMLIGILNSSGAFTQENVGGTSLAAPLVAGMVTAAQQGQSKPFGFLDPTFYKIAGTMALHDPLPLTKASPPLWRAEVCATVALCGPGLFLNQMDDQSTNLPAYTGQVTAKGYDNMTGVGTPNGLAFITALRAIG